MFNGDRLLKPKYEVVVIGSGLGGLTTASLLAKRGVDVLVIEQHSIPGGACSSFRREGRVYDAGAALIFGFSTEGYNLISTLINFLEEPIKVIPRDKFFRMDFAGREINFWKDLDKFVRELEGVFPESKKEVRELYKHLTNFYNKNVKNRNLLTPPSDMSDAEKTRMLRNPLRVIRLQRLLSQSALDFMGRYIRSEELLNFYDKLCASYAYITMRETPAIMAITMFTDNHMGGTNYVAKSAQTYSNTLERAIERNGGTIVYCRRVEKILFEGDRASGVVLTDGSTIRADRVVSDTTVWNLYNELIPPEKLTPKQKSWANSFIPTYPAMVLYAAVDRSIFPSDINPVEYYISDPHQIDMNDITLYIPTVDDASLGPQDEHIVTIFSPAPKTTWPHPWDEDYQSPDYIEKKERQAKLIIEQIEARIPGFSGGIRRLYVATPSTIERYTLKNNGCVGGPKQMIGQELTRRLHAKTDWPGLYACGDSTTMGMGMPAVTASGFGAANVILREMNKKEYQSGDTENNYVTYIDSQPPLSEPEEIGDSPENAGLAARQCQQCENQPCRKACPANIDIAGFLRRIEAENYGGAARLIRETNPLPEVCGLLCESKELCEKACIRTDYASKPVEIRELLRWVAKYSGEEGWSKPVSTANGKSVCVIGSGPEGLTCSYYLARLGYAVELLDEREKPGGELRDLVADGKLDSDALERDLKAILLPSIKFRGNVAVTNYAELLKLSQQHTAIYLTHRIDSIPLESLEIDNIVVSYDTPTPNSKYHNVASAVAEGRRAAELIHNITNQ